MFEHTIFETPTYLVAYFLAFLGAILLGIRIARRWELKPVRAVDLGLVLFLSGIFGGRLFHILFEAPDYYINHPIRMLYFWQGGFVLYGGILVATAAGILFAKIVKDMPIGTWADLVAPCLMLGIAIGRLGCLGAGCCYGKATEHSWGMVFHSARSAAPVNVALFPTQLVEIIFTAAFCAVLLLVFKKPPRIPGSSLVISFLGYSVFRFFIEFQRGDDDRGLYFGGALSTSQMISLLIIAGSLLWLFLCRPRGQVS